MQVDADAKGVCAGGCKFSRCVCRRGLAQPMGVCMQVDVDAKGVCLPVGATTAGVRAGGGWHSPWRSACK